MTITCYAQFLVNNQNYARIVWFHNNYYDRASFKSKVERVPL